MPRCCEKGKRKKRKENNTGRNGAEVFTSADASKEVYSDLVLNYLPYMYWDCIFQHDVALWSKVKVNALFSLRSRDLLRVWML